MNKTVEDIIAEAINGAADFTALLDELVEIARTDPGAPFRPEVLQQIGALKKTISRPLSRCGHA
jgi:hypothetical protein